MDERLPEQNYNRSIEASLEERRSNSRRALDLRRELIYGSIPEIESIEYEIAAAGLKHNRALLNGDQSLSETQSGLESEINALRIKCVGLLRSNGFSEDSLELKPECVLCGDSGYITGAKGVPERCECYKQLLFSGLKSSSNILSAGTAGFDLFDESIFSDAADAKKYKSASSPRDNIIKIRDSAKQFVKAFNAGKNENLYFFGKPGTGKTFIAASIAYEIMRGGTAVLYLSAPALFNIITEHQIRYLRDDTYQDFLYRQIFTCRLLIMDDLGTENITEARYSEFVALLNERLSSGGRSTIISTNQDINELKNRYDERILSRILGSFRIVRFYGEDLRLGAAK